MLAQRLRDDIQAVAIRQHDIGDQHVRREACERAALLGEARGRLDEMALAPQRLAHDGADRGVVVDQQDALAAHRMSARWSISRKTVRKGLPSRAYSIRPP